MEAFSKTQEDSVSNIERTQKALPAQGLSSDYVLTLQCHVILTLQCHYPEQLVLGPDLPYAFFSVQVVYVAMLRL